MKGRYLIILFSLLCLNLSPVQARGEICTDTLSYDLSKVTEYQQDGRYDYNSQLTIQDPGWWDLLIRWIGKGLSAVFGNKFARTYAEPVLIGIFVIFVLLLIFFIYKKRPELFLRNKKPKLEHRIEEETIYDVDFEDEIANSLRVNDYKLAIRLTYLQTLRFLNDQSYLNWQPYKTPTEYIYEMKKTDSKPEFRQLTNHFLRIRYGNFSATRETYDAVKDLQMQIRKGGAYER